MPHRTDLAKELERASWRRRREDPAMVAKDRARSAARYRANRDASLAYSRAWAAANRETVLAASKERYYNTDVRKRFARGANRNAALYGRPDDLLDYTTMPLGPWLCTYCGIACVSWDHVEQLALGGPNTAENLVPACLDCNRKRPRSKRIAGALTPLR